MLSSALVSLVLHALRWENTRLRFHTCNLWGVLLILSSIALNATCMYGIQIQLILHGAITYPALTPVALIISYLMSIIYEAIIQEL